MADSRHRHSRKAPRRLRLARVILPAFGLATVAAAGTLVVIHEEQSPAAASVAAKQAPKEDVFAAAAKQQPATISRSAERVPVPNEAEAEEQVEGTRFAVEGLQIHASADEASQVLASVDSGDTVDITGKTKGDYAQIIHKGLPRWVVAKSLATEMPLGTTPCPTGSEGGLQPDTVKVLRAVCAKYPSIVRYGGIAGRGEHATGHALDIMVGVGNPIGDDVAAFVMEHRQELGVEYIIWKQRIWRPATSASWRGMSSRGGATANHLDHVHVTTYGQSAAK